MPVQAWTDVRDQLESLLHDSSYVPLPLAGKTCPQCAKTYPADAKTIVCKVDGTMLMTSYFFERQIVSEIAEGLTKQSYEVKGLIGDGDLTYVFEAEDSKSKKPVIVKVIKPPILGAARRVQKFAKTLHEVIDLQHPNIVTVLNTGIAGTPSGSLAQVYFVAEKLDAINLKILLKQMGKLPPQLVTEIMVQVCDVLEHAHRKGWLHQNLKPSNIYVWVENDQIKLKMSDFGVAERMFRHLEWDNEQTKTGSIYGNIAYIAPEIAFGKDASVQSEIYSLGCLMYHLLKGAPLFDAWSDFSAVLMHRDKQPMPFAADLHVPSSLEATVMKCLAKQPQDRYQSFAELKEALSTAAPEFDSVVHSILSSE